MQNENQRKLSKERLYLKVYAKKKKGTISTWEWRYCNKENILIIISTSVSRVLLLQSELNKVKRKQVWASGMDGSGMTGQKIGECFI